MQKLGSATTYYIADPNNDAEAVEFSVESGSHMFEVGSCSTNGSYTTGPVYVPAYEVTIAIAYPVNVIFD